MITAMKKYREALSWTLALVIPFMCAIALGFAVKAMTEQPQTTTVHIQEAPQDSDVLHA